MRVQVRSGAYPSPCGPPAQGSYCRSDNDSVKDNVPHCGAFSGDVSTSVIIS